MTILLNLHLSAGDMDEQQQPGRILFSGVQQHQHQQIEQKEAENWD